MRVLLLRPGPNFSVQDVAFGWRDGLTEIGVTVADCNFDERLDFYASAHIDRSAGDGEWVKAFDRDDAVHLAADSVLADCYKFLPDVAVIVSGFFVPAETVDLLRKRGVKIVYLFTESPYEDDHQLRRAAFGDLCILNDPTNLEQFRQVCPQTFYIPHAYDPKKHYPGAGDPERASDFAFVGTGFPSRIEFFEQVDFSGIDALFGGMWLGLDEDSPLNALLAHKREFCIDNTETADVYRSTKTSLNLYRREASAAGMEAGWAMGPREVELAACGTFFLRDPRPESDDVFPFLPTFTDPGEVRPLLDWALAHDAERETAALKARAAIADRTFQAHAAWLARQLGD